MRKRITLSKTFGFSLLEVIVAMGILSVGGYFLVSLLTNSMKQQKSVTAVDDLRSLVIDMNSMLTNPQACLNTFGGTNPQTGVASLPAIKDATGNAAFSISETYGNKAIVLTNIAEGGQGIDAGTNLQKYEARSATEGVALILVSGKKKTDTAGPSSITRYFRIRAKLDGAGSIIACSAMGSGSMDQIWQRSSANPADIFYDGGNVGVGVNEPEATLDVKGGIRPGSIIGGVAVKTGQPCGAGVTEGTLAYDVTSHGPVFCDASSQWEAVGGSGESWGTKVGAIEISTYYTAQWGSYINLPTVPLPTVGNVVTAAQLKSFINDGSPNGAGSSNDDRFNTLSGHWKLRKIVGTGAVTDTSNGWGVNQTMAPVYNLYWQRID